MNRAFCITMYKEYGTVDKTLRNIRDTFNDAYIVLVHSTDSETYYTPVANEIVRLPDYGKILTDKYQIPSHAISRNYSVGFTHLYNTLIPFDYIVALCGDTLVTDATNFDRRFAEMKEKDKDACVTQAIGQIFYGRDADPPKGIVHERRQDENTTDFMPQMFIVDGKKAIEKKLFSNIIITNKYTSEQCLGDELTYKMKRFNVIRLARNAYDYFDGIKYQYGE